MHLPGFYCKDKYTFKSKKSNYRPDKYRCKEIIYMQAAVISGMNLLYYSQFEKGSWILFFKNPFFSNVCITDYSY